MINETYLNVETFLNDAICYLIRRVREIKNTRARFEADLSAWRGDGCRPATLAEAERLYEEMNQLQSDVEQRLAEVRAIRNEIIKIKLRGAQDGARLKYRMKSFLSLVEQLPENPKKEFFLAEIKNKMSFRDKLVELPIPFCLDELDARIRESSQHRIELEELVYDLERDTLDRLNTLETSIGGNGEPNFGTRPDVRNRRMKIYDRREQILNGRLTVKMLSEEYVVATRTIEEDLRNLSISRK